MTAKLTTHHAHITPSTAHNTTHNTHFQKDIMFQVVLVGFLPTDNGRSCEHHPFGCGNALVLERDSHGVGLQIRLRMVDGNSLAGYQIQVDGSDGCRVCFAAREYAVGVGGQRLNGASVRIQEMVLPDDENTSKRALFHRNRGYAIAQLYDPGPNWNTHRTAQDDSDVE